MGFFNKNPPPSKKENKASIASLDVNSEGARSEDAIYEVNAYAPTPIRKNSKRNLMSDSDAAGCCYGDTRRSIQATHSSDSAPRRPVHKSSSSNNAASNEYFNYREKGNDRLPRQIKDLNNEVAQMMLDTLQHKKSSYESPNSSSSTSKFWKLKSKSQDSSDRKEPLLLTADNFKRNQENPNSKTSTKFWNKKSRANDNHDTKEVTLSANNDRKERTKNSHQHKHLDNTDDTGSRQGSNMGVLSLDYSNMSYFTDKEKEIIQRLAKRKYHLPGNSYWQDYCEYLVNNHQILCFCFRHPLHPLRMSDRVFILVGSLGFGVFITNVVVILYSIYDLDFNQEVLSIFGNNERGFTITKGMISMWISGGIIHSLFDCCVWYITACPCVQAGGFITKKSKKIAFCFRFLGRNLASVIVIVCISFATAAISLRAEMTAKDEDQQQQQQNFEKQTSLLILYLVELGFSLFVFNPIIKFIMFTGIIGCFKVPVFGGRPYEMRQEEESQEENRLDVYRQKIREQQKAYSKMSGHRDGSKGYQIA